MFLFVGGALGTCLGSFCFWDDKGVFSFPSKYLGVSFTVNLICSTAFLVIVCFWIRLATGRAVYSARVNDGDVYFLFTSVPVHNKKGAIFMAIMFALLLCYSFIQLIGIFAKYVQWYSREAEVGAVSGYCGNPAREVRRRQHRERQHKHARAALERARRDAAPRSRWSLIFSPVIKRK